MKLKVFTLRLDASTGRFDDADVVAFLAEREALSVTEHFFVHEQVPTLALLVTWRDGLPARVPRERPAPEDPTADLTAEERALYETIRRWRNERARRDGRPSYIYLNNREMADVARRRPASRAELETIHGIGEGKAAQWGDEIIALIRAATQPVAGPDPVGQANAGP